MSARSSALVPTNSSVRAHLLQRGIGDQLCCPQSDFDYHHRVVDIVSHIDGMIITRDQRDGLVGFGIHPEQDGLQRSQLGTRIRTDHTIAGPTVEHVRRGGIRSSQEIFVDHTHAALLLIRSSRTPP